MRPETGAATVGGVTADTFLQQGGPLMNWGSSDRIESDMSTFIEPILIRFDLAAIPSTATIMAASLTLEITDPSSDGRLDVYRLLEDWDEGTFAGAPGTANWGDRQVGVAWTSQGAGPGSRDSVVIGVASALATLGPIQIDLAPATVQLWVTTPSENHGIGLYNDTPLGDGLHCASSENPTASLRPVLSITYAP